jgi:hypothetical protein
VYPHSGKKRQVCFEHRPVSEGQERRLKCGDQLAEKSYDQNWRPPNAAERYSSNGEQQRPTNETS